MAGKQNLMEFDGVERSDIMERDLSPSSAVKDDSKQEFDEIVPRLHAGEDPRSSSGEAPVKIREAAATKRAKNRAARELLRFDRSQTSWILTGDREESSQTSLAGDREEEKKKEAGEECSGGRWSMAGARWSSKKWGLGQGGFGENVNQG
ncbi:hypothetical protein L484_025343 [Morus notabilis]|uniref:Uncharacterized protein n=1 Tax=Morus notabilis TaxID=981085 RepID=W9RAC8_9ROSA|nr:hypothetical protein L484_025343 [Morus notabilis]